MRAAQAIVYVILLICLQAGCRGDESVSREYLDQFAAANEPSALIELAQRIATETKEEPQRLALVVNGLDLKQAKDVVFLALLARYAREPEHVEAWASAVLDVKISEVGLDTWGPADSALVGCVFPEPEEEYSDEARKVLAAIGRDLAINVARKELNQWRKNNPESPLIPLCDALHANPDRRIRLVVDGPDEVKDAAPYATAEELELVTRKYEGLRGRIGSRVTEQFRNWFSGCFPMGPLELAETESPGPEDLLLTVRYTATTTEWVYGLSEGGTSRSLPHGLVLKLSVTVATTGATLWEAKDLLAQTPQSFQLIGAQFEIKPRQSDILLSTMRALVEAINLAAGRD